jgi:hypothetical protein
MIHLPMQYEPKDSFAIYSGLDKVIGAEKLMQQ